MFKRFWNLLKEYAFVCTILGLPIWIMYFVCCNSMMEDIDPYWWKFWRSWKKDKPEKDEKDIDDLELWDLDD